MNVVILDKKKLSFLFVLFLLALTPLKSQTISVGSKSFSADTVSHFKVGPDSYFTALKLSDGTKSLKTFFLEINANSPYVKLKTVLGKDSTLTNEQPSSMAKRKTSSGSVYFAGTNADFFVTQGQVGLPVAGCMVNGQIARVPNTRPVFSFDNMNKSFIGVNTYAGTVVNGQNSFVINGINDTRDADELILYNTFNGNYTHTNSYGTEILVEPVSDSWSVNKPLLVRVLDVVSGKGNMQIPSGKAVLSGHGVAQTFLNSLHVNDEISLQLNVTLDLENPQFMEMVGGDRVILKDGIVQENDWAELHPRTAIGYSEDKSKIYFCVVDGRSSVSAGVTTKQLADIIKSAGAFTALNMDGGGSSCMYVKEFGPMNAPSDGVERSVANGIFAVSSAPTDNVISEIQSYTRKIKLPRYGVFMPSFLGYNQYGALLNKDLQGVVLSCEPQVGTIASDGRFVASGTSGGMVTATYNGNIQTEFEVELVASAEIAFKLDSVLIDSKKEYSVEIQSIIDQNTMEVLPGALTWVSNNPSVCSVEGGILKGFSNGSTYVVGQLGDFKDTLKVKVEIPESGRVVVNSFNTSTWTLDASSALNASLGVQNLPTSWSTGFSVNYVYASTRAPYVKLLSSLALYSLPDTIKITMNLGDITLSKLLVSFNANNSTQSVTSTITGIPSNKDYAVEIPFATLLSTSDIATFPIWLNYLNFYLGSQTESQAYTLALKDITLCYAGYEVSATPSVLISGFSVYPNPVSGDGVYIHFKDGTLVPAVVSLYSIKGDLISTQTQNLSTQSSEMFFKTGVLQKGTYLLKVKLDKVSESVKLIVH